MRSEREMLIDGYESEICRIGKVINGWGHEIHEDCKEIKQLREDFNKAVDRLLELKERKK